MRFTTAAEEKAALRRNVKQVLSGLSEEARRSSDERLFAAFLSLPQVQRAKTLLLFLGMGTEPDTARLIPPLREQGKAVALPRCLPGSRMEARLWDGKTPLVRHAYGMDEPDGRCPLAAREQLDLILVPALCYDARGFRLGRGGGFYDRYLAGFSGCTVGLCRDAVLQPRLPAEEHDLPVRIVVTETTCKETRPPEGGPVSAVEHARGK